MESETLYFSGPLLLAARELAGYTQEQLAARLVLAGVRKTTRKQSIAGWEGGIFVPGADVIPSLATILGVEVLSLFAPRVAKGLAKG